MRKVATIFALLFIASSAMAQEVEFTADRPGASTAPAVVGRKELTLSAELKRKDCGYDDYKV